MEKVRLYDKGPARSDATLQVLLTSSDSYLVRDYM